MLHDPPDFGIMALSDEPRLGLFVVARLAARHGISVHLRESAYGGTRAIVLVRTDLLAPIQESVEPDSGPMVAAVPEQPAEPDPADEIPVLRQPRRRTRTEPPPVRTAEPVSGGFAGPVPSEPIIRPVEPVTTANPPTPPPAPAVPPAPPTAPAAAPVPVTAGATPVSDNGAARPPAPPARAARPTRPVHQPSCPQQVPRPAPEPPPQQPR